MILRLSSEDYWLGALWSTTYGHGRGWAWFWGEGWAGMGMGMSSTVYPPIKPQEWQCSRTWTYIFRYAYTEASPQVLPLSQPIFTQHASSNLTTKFPRHTHPCTSMTSARIEYIQVKQLLEKHMRHGQMQSKLPIPNAVRLFLGNFPKPEKKAKKQRQGSQPTPFL